jgi:rRNA-processing protein FCF1
MASDRLWRDREGKIVVLDSSSILMLFDFSINLEGELTRLLGKFKVFIPRPIFDELIFLSKHGKGKKKYNSKPALDLINKYEIIEAEGTGDDSVLFLAKKLNGIVVTNDKDLRKRAKDIHLHTIYLREKSKLVLD